MKELLKDVLEMKGVKGVIIFSDKGDCLIKEMSSDDVKDASDDDLSFILDTVKRYREIELIYEKGRLYARKIEIGILLIIMDIFVQMAMVRLNCDIILPSLQSIKTDKKFRKFFKK